ncbi:Mpv17/PMP22 [Purpureocillium lavendulum]|uniref:Mpv17/PMP22 n=1 Tax=Purpureocillium lavendulum TaxID=1247861 RepID=A0AB34FVW3_9HYPO|nr:Mpv17/PMP22 [Purpureocillium lavendulum]
MNSVTTAVLFATGDITAQQLVDKRGLQKHDLARTGRMALYGGCEPPRVPDPFWPSLLRRVFGPVATTWFGILARRVNLRNPRLETLARVGCDQTLFAPVMIGVFLSSMATMEGASAKERLEKTWWPALKTNWMIWPFVQFVNFTFLPLQHRVLFANVISIGWNCYLSWVNSQPDEEKAEVEAPQEAHDGDNLKRLAQLARRAGPDKSELGAPVEEPRLRGDGHDLLAVARVAPPRAVLPGRDRRAVEADELPPRVEAAGEGAHLVAVAVAPLERFCPVVAANAQGEAVRAAPVARHADLDGRVTVFVTAADADERAAELAAPLDTDGGDGGRGLVRAGVQDRLAEAEAVDKFAGGLDGEERLTSLCGNRIVEPDDDGVDDDDVDVDDKADGGGSNAVAGSMWWWYWYPASS